VTTISASKAAPRKVPATAVATAAKVSAAAMSATPASAVGERGAAQTERGRTSHQHQ
jgi:hypothetical protein